MAYHSLLRRQIERFLAGIDTAGEPLASFLAAVNEAYLGSDMDRAMVERAMDLSPAELLEANWELRGLLHAFPDLILHVDDTGLVVGVRGHRRDGFWDEDRLKGRRLSALFGAPMGEMFDAALRRAIADGVIERLEFIERTSTVAHIDELRIAPLGRAGGIVLVRDVTEQRSADELRRAKELAEAASRAKSAFIANMGHELRTPLNAIIGYSELVKEELELDESPCIPDVDRILNAARHLLLIINDVLDMSKIEAGRMELDIQEFDLNDAIDSVGATIAPLAAKGGNTLLLEVPLHLGQIRTDRMKLKQMLINLLANACKFTHDGEVQLAVTRTIGDGDQPGLITIHVRDTGIGMSEEQITRVFDEFSQVDSSTTRRYGGTGLGLAITGRLCTLLGGSMRVSSQLTHGSTFTLELPDLLPRTTLRTIPTDSADLRRAPPRPEVRSR